VGSAIADAALAARLRLRAVVRDKERSEAAAWRDSRRVETVAIDLAAPGARAALDQALDGVDAVIHAAAAMSGNDDAHARDTIAPTKTLIAAMTARTRPPRLVLLSSLSVYNFASTPDSAVLDETTPLEPEPAMRDAYCRAKLAQEALARTAAQTGGLEVRALRAGAIVGPGRLRTARLGFALGPFLLSPGGRAAVPGIAVADCAALALAAAFTPPMRSDVPTIAGAGWFEAINLVDADTLDQSAFAAAIASAGWPRATLRLPLKLVRAPIQALSLAGMIAPIVARLTPGALRLETFEARFKPLRYAVARAEDRLGARWDRPFAETLRALAAGEAGR
jgi:nucleoside-diphosphate-sugar epimerase